MLREAEDLFEHATFWDRAMILVTYSRLELTGDVGRIAMPIAREQPPPLDEPAMKGAPLAPFAEAVKAARRRREPAAAWRGVALYLWMRDERLQRYRLPMRGRARRGSVGVEGFVGGGGGRIPGG